jgi:FkbM family methyltransferase
MRRFAKQLLQRSIFGTHAISSRLRDLALRSPRVASLAERFSLEGDFDIELSPLGVPGAIRYRAFPGDAFGNQLLWHPITAFENATVAYLVRTLSEPSDHARHLIDVGANTGFFSLLMLALDARATVTAFEPTPRIYSGLVTNLHINDFSSRGCAVSAALSDQHGTMTLHVPRNDSTAASLARDHAQKFAYGAAVEEFSVSVTPFDDLALPGPICGCKIDVEGHELHVLRGMSTMLARDKPWLIVEALTLERLDELRKFLDPFGYQTSQTHLSGVRPEFTAGNFLFEQTRSS